MGDWVAVAIASDVCSCVGGWKEVRDGKEMVEIETWQRFKHHIGQAMWTVFLHASIAPSIHPLHQIIHRRHQHPSGHVFKASKISGITMQNARR